MKLERLRGEHYEEFIDFADLVFSRDGGPVYFREDLPVCFAPDDEHMSRVYALRDEGGRLASAVALIPYTMRLGEETFQVKTVTTVATHYRQEGKGCMRRVMSWAMEETEKDGTDFLVLHGNRERYRNYGFEPIGVGETAKFEAYNIPNRAKREQVCGYHFEEIRDPARVKECVALYDRYEPAGFVRREEDFLTFQKMWKAAPLAVLDEAGAFCGYLNYFDRFAGSYAIRELVLTPGTDPVRVIDSLLKEKGLKSVTVHFSPFREDMVRRIYEGAEYVHASQVTRARMLKPERVLRAALELRRRSGVWMPEGEVTVDSPLGRLCIANHGGFSVTKTEREPELTLSRWEAQALFFGPSVRAVPIYGEKLGMLGAWFPAAFYISNTDLY